MLPLESTFLAWVDVSKLNYEDVYQLLVDHGVGLSPGEGFNDKNFLRLNFGCQRHVLEEAVRRIRQALATIA